jgi:hypothetical protein
MSRSPHATALALASLLLPAVASAGIVMTFETREPGGAQAHAGTIWIEGKNARIQSSGGEAIYRGDKDLVWFMQAGEKTYLELTRQEVTRMSAQIDALTAQVQAQLASLPPEQRAMAEKMMAGQMGQAAGMKPEPVRFTPLGKTETINGWPCTGYAVSGGGSERREAWVTDYASFGLTANDLQPLRGLTELMSPLGKHAAKGRQGAFSAAFEAEVPGLPVRTLTFLPGGQSAHEIKTFAREDVPASQFDLPPGLKRQPLPSMEAPSH